MPVVPGSELINLILDIRSIDAAARSLDEDTGDHVEAILGAGRTNVLKSVAVGGVDTEQGKAGLLDGSDISVNLARALASATGGLVRSISNTQAVIVAGQTSIVGVRRRLLGSLGGLSRGGRGRSLSLDWGGSRSGSWETFAAQRADVCVASLGNGDDLLGSSVSTGLVASRSGIDDDGLLAHGGGDGSNGVSTSAGADIGGLDNGAGGDAAAGVNSSDRASDGGGRHDNSGNTTNGVSTRGNLGRGGTTDGGGRRDGDSSRRERVGARSRASVDYGSRHNNDLSGRRGRRRRRSLSGRLGHSRDGLGLGLGLGGVNDDYSQRVSGVERLLSSVLYMLTAGHDQCGQYLYARYTYE